MFQYKEVSELRHPRCIFPDKLYFQHLSLPFCYSYSLDPPPPPPFQYSMNGPVYQACRLHHI